MDLVLSNGFCELTEEESLFIDGGFWTSIAVLIAVVAVGVVSINSASKGDMSNSDFGNISEGMTSIGKGGGGALGLSYCHMNCNDGFSFFI